MSPTRFVLFLLLLPGLLLPLGARLNVCLCVEGGGCVPNRCEGMHCCSETHHDASRHVPLVAAPACAGCRSLVAPTSPSSLGPTVLDAGALLAPPETSPIFVAVVALPNRESVASTVVRGPPLSSRIVPLRI